MAGAGTAGAAGVNVDDVGYETARLKLVDVMGQICTMLRQRGMSITVIVGHACRLEPIDGIATTEDQTDSERAVVSALSLPAVGNLGIGSGGGETIQPSIVAVNTERAPPRSIVRVHVERGLAAFGDQTWVYMFNAGKVGVKKCKPMLDALDEIVEMQQGSGAGSGESAAVSEESSSSSSLSHVTPQRVIVVSREKMTTQTEEAIRTRGYILEKFLLNELSYNITRHFLVPRHEMCNAEEIAQLKKKYGKMALQNRDDAITRFYGMLPGDIILYRRVRLGSMGALYYREIH